MNSIALLLAAETEPGGTSMLQGITAFIAERGVSFGLDVLAAVLIFLVGRWVAKLVRALIRKLMTRAQVDEMLINFVAHMAYIALLVMVVVAALNRLGINTTSVAAAIAAAGLAVGLALKDSLTNFAAGVMIILYRPFKIGDFIDAGGTTGVVEGIQMFHTLMRTGDNVQIIVPNGGILGGTITNFSAKDTRRIDLVVGCGYDDDIKAVKEYLEELVRSDERILKDPEPVVAVNELGASSVDFVVRPWVNASDYWAVRWDLTERIKVEFDQRGFNIPYPCQTVHVEGLSATT